MRSFAVAFTRYLAPVGLFIGALCLAVGTPWRFPAMAFAAAAWFAALSEWIRRTPRTAVRPGPNSDDETGAIDA